MVEADADTETAAEDDPAQVPDQTNATPGLEDHSFHITAEINEEEPVVERYF